MQKGLVEGVWASMGVAWAWLLGFLVVYMLFASLAAVGYMHELTFGPRMTRNWRIGFWTVTMLALVSSTSWVVMRYIVFITYLVLIWLADHYSGLHD